MPAGWTNVLDLEGGTGTWGVDTGTRRVTIFRKDTVTGSESGTVTVSLAGTTANTLRAVIVRIESAIGATVGLASSTGDDTTRATSFSVTGSTAIDMAAGDLLLYAISTDIDTATHASQALTASGLTFTRTNRATTAVTNGNDHRQVIETATMTGSGTSAPTYAATLSVAGSGVAGFLRIREVADTTAPTLTSPTATVTGTTTATGTVSTNEANGTLFFRATVNATETIATVKAGSSQAVTATGVQNVSVTGLTAGTAYYLHYVHTDAAANDSARVTSAQFTTWIAPTITTQPTNQSATVGNTATFTASAPNGTPTATRQWQVLDGGAPPLTASDDLNRADGPLGSNWSILQGTGATIVSNAMTFAGSDSIIRWQGSTFAADQQAELTLDSPFSGALGGAVRIRSSDGAGYAVGTEFNNTTINLYRHDGGGSFTSLGQVTGLSMVGGDRVGIRIVGSTIRVLLNGSIVGSSFTDTTYTTGNPGVYGFGGSGTNWQAEEIGGGGSWTDISGATSQNYTTPTLVIGDNGKQYRFIDTNTGGSVTSNAVTLTVTAGGGSYTLTALGGTYTLTGGTAVLEKDRRLTAQGGSYTATGSSATVNRNRRLIPNGGAYTLTGGTAVLEKDRRLTASGGAYTLTGASAILEKDRRLTASGGSYTVTGSQADLTYSAGAVSYTLTCIGGAYVATGAAAVLRRNRRLTSLGGSYAATGASAILEKDRRLTASGGTYTIAGGTAVLTGGTPLDAANGLFWPIVRRRRR